MLTIEKIQINISFRYLQSTQLHKRLLGLKYIQDIFTLVFKTSKEKGNYQVVLEANQLKAKNKEKYTSSSSSSSASPSSSASSIGKKGLGSFVSGVVGTALGMAGLGKATDYSHESIGGIFSKNRENSSSNGMKNQFGHHQKYTADNYPFLTIVNVDLETKKKNSMNYPRVPSQNHDPILYSYLDIPYLLQWINHFNLIEELIGSRMHLEILSKCSEILQFA